MTTLLRLTVLAAWLTAGLGLQAAEKDFPVTDAWLAQVKEAAPAAESAAKPAAPRKVLVISIATGFQHWVIPHVEQAVKIIGEKSGAFEAVLSKDIRDLSADKLSQYDAVVLNNTCPERTHRHLFRDILVDQWDKRGKYYEDKSAEERLALAEAMKDALVAYVAGGKGIVTIHGGSTTFINSANFDEMHGGSFESHLAQQQINYKVVNPEHPMMKGVPATGFSIVDEPYMYKGSYQKFDFRPLLQGEVAPAGDKKGAYQAMPRYAAWIRAHGQGRVFHVSPSHNGSAYTDKGILQFYLNGIQYAVGDLKCDDSPIGPPAK